MKYFTSVNEQEFVIEIDQENEITVNGERYAIDFRQLPEAGLTSLLLNNHSLEAVVEDREDIWEVLIHGLLYAVRVQDERAYRLAQARGQSFESHQGEVIAPMPGIIIDTSVSLGDRVQKGDKVIILESMKMENELRAPRNGTVAQILVTSGDSVEKDQVLVLIDEIEEDA